MDEQIYNVRSERNVCYKNYDLYTEVYKDRLLRENKWEQFSPLGDSSAFKRAAFKQKIKGLELEIQALTLEYGDKINE